MRLARRGCRRAARRTATGATRTRTSTRRTAHGMTTVRSADRDRDGFIPYERAIEEYTHIYRDIDAPTERQ